MTPPDPAPLADAELLSDLAQDLAERAPEARAALDRLALADDVGARADLADALHAIAGAAALAGLPDLAEPAREAEVALKRGPRLDGPARARLDEVVRALERAAASLASTMTERTSP